MPESQAGDDKDALSSPVVSNALERKFKSGAQILGPLA
jgi:hypothetical protein